MMGRKKSYFMIVILVLICAFGLSKVKSFEKGVTKGKEEIQAKTDCLNIARALLYFYKDTGNWPYYNDCWEGRTMEPQVDYLYGNMGDMPEFTEDALESWGDVAVDMFYGLVTWGDERCSWYKPKPATSNGEIMTPYPRVGWNGPYLSPYIGADPWGFKYLVSINGMEPAGKRPENWVWCLSAGPNGVVDTPAWSPEIEGDDIGYRAE